MTAVVIPLRGRRTGWAGLGDRTLFSVHAAPGGAVEAVAPDGRRLALWRKGQPVGRCIAMLQEAMVSEIADDYARRSLDEW